MCKSPAGVTSKLPALKKSPPEGVLCTGTELADGFFWATGFTSLFFRLHISRLGTGDGPFSTGLPGIEFSAPESWSPLLASAFAERIVGKGDAIMTMGGRLVLLPSALLAPPRGGSWPCTSSSEVVT